MKQFSIYGCNALYRDFEPHNLIATDKPILKEIIDSLFPRESYPEGYKKGSDRILTDTLHLLPKAFNDVEFKENDDRGIELNNDKTVKTMWNTYCG